MSEIKQILEDLGYKLKDFGSHFRTKPLYRDSGNETSLSINKVTGGWYDFSLSRGGEFNELLKLMGKEGVELQQQLNPSFYEEPLDVKTFSPEIVKSLSKQYDYWVQRGVSEATVKEFGGGVDYQWKLKNRYVFPVYDGRNKIVGLFGRDLTGNPKVPKYKILGKKKDFRWPLYLNHQIIQDSKIVILTESPACILRLWDAGIKNAVCLFGTDISGSLIGLLIRYNLKKIIIATNNEPDNASIGNLAAKKIERKLLEFFDPANVIVKLPTKKDFAEMTNLEIESWSKS